MARVIRVTGAWSGLLRDWLEAERIHAPEIRAALARFAPDDEVPIPVWRDLLTRAVALRPSLEAPGLAIGALVEPRHVGVLGYLVLASATLGDALLAYQRYERLFYGADLAELAAVDDDVEIRWRPDAAALGALGDSVAIAALVTFLRQRLEAPSTPVRIAFAFDAPPDAHAYEEFFGCPVVFGDTHTRVRLPRAYLALAMPHRDPHLRAILDGQAKALLDTIPEPDDFDRALSQALLRALPEGAAGATDLARRMHVSVRTLQRRLASRDLTWQAFLDRTRTELARRYLEDASLSLTDVAMLLGYSEQSAFTRAFRRCTGTTPARARLAATHATRRRRSIPRR